MRATRWALIYTNLIPCLPQLGTSYVLNLNWRGQHDGSLHTNPNLTHCLTPLGTSYHFLLDAEFNTYLNLIPCLPQLDSSYVLNLGR